MQERGGTHALHAVSCFLALFILAIPGEMLCSCIHRRKWVRIEAWVDRKWRDMTGDPHHCATCWRWDRARGRYGDLSERV